MPKRVSKEEQTLYEPVRKALQRVFSCLGDCHLEVTADKHFSRKLKKAFDDVALYMIAVEKFYPDISGFVKTKYSTDIITVEVKTGEPLIKDIFQTKNYAQVFNAKYSILISPKTISEERRRLILKRRELISRYPREPVIITRFVNILEEFEIDKELYYGSLPEPFKSNEEMKEKEKLEIIATDFGLGSIGVQVQNIGDMDVTIVEAKINNQSFIQDVILEPIDIKYIDVSVEWCPGKKYEVELITKNGRRFSHVFSAP